MVFMSKLIILASCFGSYYNYVGKKVLSMNNIVHKHIIQIEFIIIFNNLLENFNANNF